MSRLTLHLLGSPRFQLDEAVISIPRRKVAALLIYLAVTAKAHSRDVLIDLLFPKQSRSRARADFRNTLSILKNSLGENRLGVEGSAVSLSTGNDLWVDVHEFCTLIADKERAQTTGPTGERIRKLTAAAALYRSDFLSGFYLKDSPRFDEWQLLVQEELRGRYSTVLEQLLGAFEKREEFESAIEYGRRWLALDPLEEAVHRELIRLYASSGHRALALRQYETCRMILHSELGEDPEEETQALVEAIRAKRFVQHRKSRRKEHSSNLPVEPLPFIGRETEISRLLDTLEREEVQILTLTGTGGTGKTRLAVEAAARLLDRFEHGVFFVDLTRAQDPAEVVPTIARVLEVREPIGHGSSLLAVLKSYLRSRRLLVLLDNFEHVSRAAEQVTVLTSACPHLKILVTSRERLRIRGEQEMRIPPLRIPTSADGRNPQSLFRVEAVRLFAQRAVAANPNFSLTDENVADVAEICRHLDGLPLAIELAASLLKILSPRELMRKLTDRLELLWEDSSTRPMRHQTLRSAIEWSYNLLEEQQKKLFIDLSVFSGGCSFQAIEQVCGSSESESEVDVLGTLAALIDKSLIRQEIVGSESRFSMFETIREYTRSRFGTNEDAGGVRNRQADYYLSLALKAESELHGPDQLRWLDTLEREIGNLHTALSWFLHGRQIKKALRLAISLEWFWYRYGHFRQGQGWLEQTLSAAVPAKYPVLTAKALHALGWMLFVQGDWPGARDLYHRSLQLCRDHGDRAGEGTVLSDLGVVERWLGDRSAGDRFCEQAVEIAREVGDPLQISIALIWAFATTGGKFERPSPVAELEEAVEISRRLKNLWGVSHGLNGLGDLLRERGKHKEARPRYEEALRGFRELKDKWMTAWTLEGLGTTLSHLEDYSSAEKYLKDSMNLFYSLGDRGNTLFIVQRLGILMRAARHHRRAARLLGAYQALYGFLVGDTAACGKKHEDELETIFREYESDHPEEWAAGQVLSFEQVVVFALRDADV